MTNVAQAILKRRSIRKFLPNKPVTREIIENILQVKYYFHRIGLVEEITVSK
jgi:nitroreductase